mgnify:CR=1 FL=1
MSERCHETLECRPEDLRRALAIHTQKITDSCRDKDCIEDLRVYPTRTSQTVIDRALSVRGGRAELLQAYIDVEPAAYNKGFFHVDIRYYYRITAEAFDARSGVWKYEWYVQAGENAPWWKEGETDSLSFDYHIYEGIDYGFCVVATEVLD